MAYASTDTLLGSLVVTCEEAAAIAARLAACARNESLRQFLHERSVSYVRATIELRDHGVSAIEEDAAEPSFPAIDGELDCVASAWEAIECSALLCFRDALDLDLPADVLATVRRRLEEGVGALERLRLTGAE